MHRTIFIGMALVLPVFFSSCAGNIDAGKTEIGKKVMICSTGLPDYMAFDGFIGASIKLDSGESYSMDLVVTRTQNGETKDILTVRNVKCPAVAFMVGESTILPEEVNSGDVIIECAVTEKGRYTYVANKYRFKCEFAGEKSPVIVSAQMLSGRKLVGVSQKVEIIKTIMDESLPAFPDEKKLTENAITLNYSIIIKPFDKNNMEQTAVLIPEVRVK